MRLFIAFDISEKAKQHLIEQQKNLKGQNLAKHFHLTLKFLGETTLTRAEEIKKRLAQIKFKQFTAQLNGTGVFPTEQTIRVIWTGLQPEETINALQKQIDDSLVPLFPKEQNFKPHITLARVKQNEKIKEHIKKIEIEPIKFEVKEFKLIESTLTPEGPKYKDLGVYKAQSL